MNFESLDNAWVPGASSQVYGDTYDFKENLHHRHPVQHAASFDAGSEASGSSRFGNSMLANMAGTTFGAYIGSGRNYVQHNMQSFLAGHDLHYYFQVNSLYVRNKLKVLLCPFLHKGAWTRVPEHVAGGMAYKPPLYDINAPDLYLPAMGLATYVILCSIMRGVGGSFTPEVLQAFVTKGLIAWAAQALLIRVGLYALATQQVPLHMPGLDVLSYSGYMFVAISINIVAAFFNKYAYYGCLLWNSLCMAVFLVKTLKRRIFAEARHYQVDSSRHNYLLLALALIQLPMAFWLGVTPLS